MFFFVPQDSDQDIGWKMHERYSLLLGCVITWILGQKWPVEQDCPVNLRDFGLLTIWTHGWIRNGTVVKLPFIVILVISALCFEIIIMSGCISPLQKYLCVALGHFYRKQVQVALSEGTGQCRSTESSSKWGKKSMS